MKIHIGGGIDHLTLVNEQEKTLCVFEDCDEETRQLAAHIVKCVNERDELVATLRDLVEIEDRDNLTDPNRMATEEHRERSWNRARAILAKAKS